VDPDPKMSSWNEIRTRMEDADQDPGI